MAILKPGDFKPGQPYRPGMLGDLAENLRGAIPKRSQGKSRKLTRLGWTRDDEDIPISCNILTGTGGIPGRVSRTLGKATNVIRQDVDADDVLVDAEEITVYNISDQAVDADKFGTALWVNDRWQVVVESCN